jgi:hypothetical protein
LRKSSMLREILPQVRLWAVRAFSSLAGRDLDGTTDLYAGPLSGLVAASLAGQSPEFFTVRV